VPVIFKDSFSAGGWTIWVTLVVRVLGHIGRTTGTIGLCCRVESLVRIWTLSLRLGSRLNREEEHDVTRAQVLTISPKSGLDTRLGLVALGKDDRIAWCWTLGPPVKVCDSDRIVPSPSRSASEPWCWVGRSVMFLFDCWLAGWPLISNPGCWTVDRS
ncbi:hypothetical protein IGI04_019220, partial [Brassica rapa subsp. trilocularis]